MGPKKGMNSKAAAAKEKKDQAKDAEKSKKAKAEEDALWAAAGEGSKTKAQAKKDDQAKQREEAALKKLEAKKLAAEEDASLSSKPAKAKSNLAPKMTSFQLQLQREAIKREKDKDELERKKKAIREVDADTYESLLARPNTNRSEEDTIEARSVGEALSALEIGSEEKDAHPERRMKAAFESYQERELPDLKLEKPGLKQSQYKDMLWKSWQKSPENPMNRAKLQQQ